MRKLIGAIILLAGVLILVGCNTPFYEPLDALNPTTINKFTCNSDDSLRECISLSGGKHTRCYLNEEKTSWDYCSSGWEVYKIPQQSDVPPYRVNNYHCYPSKDYCRLDGLLDNPKVPIEEIS